jgi:nicotinamide-nucleotide amidase
VNLNEEALGLSRRGLAIMTNELSVLAEHLGLCLKTQGKRLVAAESCTGGWIAQSVTSVPGSSAWFDRGFVTYSNTAKIDMLGVKAETLEKFGAVSAETATEMVQGALNRSRADIAVAVTGIAGPDGGTPEKPVGMVFIAWTGKSGQLCVARKCFQGDRQQIRQQTVATAIKGLLVFADCINNPSELPAM